MCCVPFSKRQPSQSAHRFGLYGQSNLFDSIAFGTVTSMPPIASMSSLKPSKSTTTTWSIGSPRSLFTVAIVSAGPPIWLAALIFASHSRESRRGGRAGSRGTRRGASPDRGDEQQRTERFASPRPGARPPSVPMTSTVVGSDRIDRSRLASCVSALGGSRLFASSTPPANARNPSSPQTTANTRSPTIASATQAPSAAGASASRMRSWPVVGRFACPSGTLPFLRPPRYSR